MEYVNGSNDDINLSRTPVLDAAPFLRVSESLAIVCTASALGIFACQFLDEWNALASLSVIYSIAARIHVRRFP